MSRHNLRGGNDSRIFRFLLVITLFGVAAGASVLATGLGARKVAQQAIMAAGSEILAANEVPDAASIACDIPEHDFRGVFEFVVLCRFPTSCGTDVRSYVRASLLTGARIGPDPLAVNVARVCVTALKPEIQRHVNDIIDQGG